MSTQLYTYFVAFTVNNGNGNAFVNMSGPVTTPADVKAMTEAISSNDSRMSSIAITNFQLMSGPDTCGACGK